ncbi:MAG TPA: alpha/beta hydrolase [Gemmatimonadales bacterium]|nr:alpha/beta hydrolase [Gemmatimonadales bacterium]
MRGEFLEIEGARLYYYASGRRGPEPPVLLLHGFATSSHLWRDVAPLIAARRRVIVMDLLGFGRSDRPGTHPVNLRGHADRAIELLNELHVQKAVVVGHEVGGGVAQLMAVRKPERVAGLGLISSVGYRDWPPSEVRVARAMLPVTRSLPADWLVALLKREMQRGFARADRAALSADIYLRQFGGDEGREALLAHLVQLDPADTVSLARHLGEISMPAAVLWGEEDPLLRPATGERLARDIRGATAHPLKNIAHFAPEEAPEMVSAILMELLER